MVVWWWYNTFTEDYARLIKSTRNSISSFKYPSHLEMKFVFFLNKQLTKVLKFKQRIIRIDWKPRYVGCISYNSSINHFAIYGERVDKQNRKLFSFILNIYLGRIKYTEWSCVQNLHQNSLLFSFPSRHPSCLLWWHQSNLETISLTLNITHI